MGPDASKPRGSHVYVGDPLRNDVYQYATADLERMDTECFVYENPDTSVSTFFDYKSILSMFVDESENYNL